MEYWNNGMLEYWGWWKEVYFYVEMALIENKNQDIIRFHTQYSIVPPFHG
jgi:hypothetical protein